MWGSGRKRGRLNSIAGTVDGDDGDAEMEEEVS
jgi:hypothetical protein